MYVVSIFYNSIKLKIIYFYIVLSYQCSISSSLYTIFV